MSDGPGDELADRVTALEQQQRADRRALGSLDADVADLQQQRRQDVRLFRSIRDTQIEQGRRLDSMGGRLDNVDGRLDSMGGRLGRVEAGLADVRSSLTLIIELLRRDAG